MLPDSRIFPWTAAAGSQDRGTDAVVPDIFVNSRDAPACVRLVAAIADGRTIEGVFGPWDRSNLGPGVIGYGVDTETIYRCQDLTRTERIILTSFLGGLDNLESFQPPLAEADTHAVQHVIEALRQITEPTEDAANE